MTRIRPRIAAVLGTRPEAVKLAPVIRALKGKASGCEVRIVSTGQHRELCGQALAALGLSADLDLGLMRPAQAPEDLLGTAVPVLRGTLAEMRADAVLVQGDTTTTLAGALAGFYQRLPVGHVEAGLRTGSLDQPYPEEGHRRLVTVLSHWHFAPTPGAAANLRREGVPSSRIFITGNPVVDAVRAMLRPDFSPERHGLALRAPCRRRVVVTAHRRESFGAPLRGICHAVDDLARRFPDTEFVFPVHPNPGVRSIVRDRWRRPRANVRLIEPLPYAVFVNLLARTALVLTDSGGIQEEAPALGLRVLILRAKTERPEALRAGARLVPLRRTAIVQAADDLLRRRRPVRDAVNPFGDGRAGARIARILSRTMRSGQPGGRGKGSG